MLKKPPREGSAKRAVYDVFTAQGRDAALKFGLSHKEPTIAKTMLERWFGIWGGAPEQAVNKAADKGSKRRLSNKEVEQIAKGPKRRRVYDVGNPNVHGTIITEGDQVSEVKWDVPSPWGAKNFASNENLREVESEPSEKDRRIFANAAEFRIVTKEKRASKSKKRDTYDKDICVSTHKKLSEAIEAAGVDENLWLFAVTKAGSIALLMRPHWAQYKLLAEATC